MTACPVAECDHEFDDPSNQAALQEHLNGTHDAEWLAWCIVEHFPAIDADRSIVEEHGHLMSSGEVHVWSNDPDVQRIYPLAERIEHGKRHGGTVLRRRVIVLDEWEEV